MRIHKTKSANMTSKELLNVVEYLYSKDELDPLIIELYERLKEIVDA